MFELSVIGRKEKVATIRSLLPSFAQEMMKMAFIAKRTEDKVNLHFAEEPKNWKLFEKNLKLKGFQKAVLEHPESDEKLKNYVKNYGDYLRSKKIVGRVSSRTKFKTYTIKELQGGRLGCNCKDWQYAHSPQASGDCFHIKDLKANMKEKVSSGPLFHVARGAGLALRFHKNLEEGQKGRIAEINRRNVYLGRPLVSVK